MRTKLHLSARVEADIREEIQEEARREGVSTANIVRKAILEHIGRKDIPMNSKLGRRVTYWINEDMGKELDRIVEDQNVNISAAARILMAKGIATERAINRS